MCTSEGFACTGGNLQVTAQNEGCKTPVYILSIVEKTQHAGNYLSNFSCLLFMPEMQFHRIGLDNMSNFIEKLAKITLWKMCFS